MGTPVPLRGFTGKGPIEALRTRTPLGEGDLESYEGSLYAQLLGGGGGGTRILGEVHTKQSRAMGPSPVACSRVGKQAPKHTLWISQQLSTVDSLHRR